VPGKMEIIKQVMAAAVSKDHDAFLSWLSDDVVYHYHVGSRPLVGKEWVRKFLVSYGGITRDVKWRIDRFTETENELWVEGYEEYYDTRSSQVVAHPYMGIIEFRDGKISAWRDYFEMNNPKQS
jgi:limonene-1,2-epoxide hydrolase